MSMRIPRSLSLQLDPDGTIRCRNPRDNRDLALSAQVVGLVAAIGAGQTLAEWAESVGVSENEARGALETLQAMGLVTDDEQERTPTSSLRERPIFVVGCHRSGTTLLRYLLDAHPNITCPPESKFILGLFALLDYPQLVPALGTMGIGPDDFLQELRALIDSLLGRCAKRAGKPRWADKTPNYWRILDFIDDLYRGEALFILVCRHPLDSVHSLYEFFGYGANDPEVSQALERHGHSRRGFAHYWSEANERIAGFAEAHADRTHLIRYEDLVARPEPVTREMLHFVGEDMPDGLVESAFTSEHDIGFQDTKIIESQSIDKDRSDRWKKWPPGEIDAVTRIVEPIARLLGYELG